MTFFYRFFIFLCIELGKVVLAITVFVGSLILANPGAKDILPKNWNELKVQAEFVQNSFEHNLRTARGLATSAVPGAEAILDLGPNPSQEKVRTVYTDLQSQLEILTQMRKKRSQQIRQLELVANGKIPDREPSDTDKLIYGNPYQQITISECRKLAGFEP